MSTEYPKIHGPFRRHVEGPERNKLIIGDWTRPEFDLLQDLPWTWTEKVDGTNIRIVWDGHRVAYGGRSDNAQIPATLIGALDALFPETMLEQVFGANAVVLYGEGYGAKIQKGGGNYRSDQSFVLFDVKAGSWWLRPGDVDDVAQKLGIGLVPPVGDDTYTVGEAIELVGQGLHSQWGSFWAEGLVGRPPLGILGRDGDRLLMKVKHVDFFKETS